MRPSALRAGIVATALCLSAASGRAQTVTLEAKGATIGDLIPKLEQETGYKFLIYDTFETRRDVAWSGKPLAAALSELASAYEVDILSTNGRGFAVLPARRPPDKETPLGEYWLRVLGPAETTDTGEFDMSLILSAKDEERIESIVGLENLRVVDNFGRDLVSPPPSISGTTAPRTRLNEYQYRLHLTAPDEASVRIRSISANVAIAPRLTPVRLEFPLDGADPEGTRSAGGEKFELERFSSFGDDATAVVRLTGSEARDLGVVGRGISRVPQPYLLDADGHIYRDNTLTQSRVRSQDGQYVREQTARFQDVSTRPVKLVYDLWTREAPGRRLPLHLANIPLPGTGQPRTAGGAFYAETGGTLSFRVTDTGGHSQEGLITVGLQLKSGAVWSAWRWLQVITQADGTARLPKVQPGIYRVRQVFRPTPTASAVGPAAPAVITVIANKETPLPPLKVVP